jgi:transposase
MKYVGIDLHKQIIVLCVVNQERKILERKEFRCQDTERIRDYFAKLGVFEAVVEATASYEWLVELIEPVAQRMVLAHPGKLRVIAESTRKTDKLDAQVLAEFLALNMIPQAYRPTARQREHRVLVRHRTQVSQQCSRIKCQIRRVLSNYNADRRDVFTAAGAEYLQSLKLSNADRFVLNQYLADLAYKKKNLEAAKKELRNFAATGPAKDREIRAVLRSTPGVGEVVSDVVMAELADVKRFRSAKQVAAYAGLVPGRRESAGKGKDLGITKEGSRILRWAMVESAWQSIRYSLKWEKIYERLKKTRGAKKAIIAVARKLLCVLVSLWKSGQSYQFSMEERPQSVPTEAEIAEMAEKEMAAEPV